MVQGSGTNQSRKASLEGLLAYQGDLDTIAKSLRSYVWDSNDLVTLTLSHIEAVLERYINREVSAVQLEHWANLIEGRDDIAYDTPHRDAIKKMIFDLANPALSGTLNILKAQAALANLRNLNPSQPVANSSHRCTKLTAHGRRDGRRCADTNQHRRRSCEEASVWTIQKNFEGGRFIMNASRRGGLLTVFTLLVLVFLMLLARPALAERRTLYVDAAATENGDGSRHRPFWRITAALLAPPL